MAGTTRYQGGLFDDRTMAMYHEAERLLPFDVFVSQGGWNAGGVAASAGTHDRAAVDVGGSLLTPGQRTQVETALRRVGFAAWVRTPAQGFTSYHIHGIPINGDTSPAARAQAVAYLNGRNGLAGNGPDTGTRAYVNVTWESYNNTAAYRPPPNTDSPEDEVTPDVIKAIADASAAAVWNTRIKEAGNVPVWELVRQAAESAAKAATPKNVHDEVTWVLQAPQFGLDKMPNRLWDQPLKPKDGSAERPAWTFVVNGE